MRSFAILLLLVCYVFGQEDKTEKRSDEDVIEELLVKEMEDHMMNDEQYEDDNTTNNEDKVVNDNFTKTDSKKEVYENDFFKEIKTVFDEEIPDEFDEEVFDEISSGSDDSDSPNIGKGPKNDPFFFGRRRRRRRRCAVKPSKS